MADLSKFENEISALGLSVSTVKKHQISLSRITSGSSKKFFQIVDTCRIDNGGILLLDAAVKTLASVAGSNHKAPFAAFIPAAGAASRYVRPLAELEAALEANDLDFGIQAITRLSEQGAASWPLPKLLASLVQHPDALLSLNKNQLEQLKTETSMPKALMPCVTEGFSFLALKMHEHGKISQLSKEFFVIPPNQTSEFRKSIDEIKSQLTPMPSEVLEQHAGLSTIRFNKDATPHFDPGGRLTMVPAGHGTLTQLFPACAGDAHSLFIRNIDNIMGTAEDVIKTTSDFLVVHDKILTLVRAIRRDLKAGDLAAAETTAQILLALIPIELNLTQQSAVPADLRALWLVQAQLFHSAMPAEPTLIDLIRLYERPVNLLGQVPNTGKDVGGTPCFVSHKGKIIKICVEVPHASPEDRNQFFLNPEKATHFNPVFATAEITSDSSYYERENDDFWLMAEKSFKGADVIYYETVLYELIGNSALANTLFIEVPRTVFNPHKTMDDASSSSITRWLK